MEPMLSVQDLSLSFVQYTYGLRQRTLQVLSNLYVEVLAGEILAVVGSSGSGKSLLAHAILGILPTNASLSGSMYYMGKKLNPAVQAALRGEEIVLIPQSIHALNPLMRVDKQVRLAVKEGDPQEIREKLFQRYGLSSKVERLFPHQLSGGMARRVLIATALANQARLVIADEPTPGLDQKVVLETANHFKQLADEGCGVLFITHDIEVALEIANRIAVFYAGTTVEIAHVQDFTNQGERLRHPYSKALWKALPQNDFTPLAGSQPLANNLPEGCLFAPRCQRATPKCTQPPPIRFVRGGMVRCHYA